jgi:hypothetical protein
VRWKPPHRLRTCGSSSWPGRAADLKAALEAENPDSRDRFKVVPDDCNVTITAILAELADLNWAPTFAFLDQQSTEVQ